MENLISDLDQKSKEITALKTQKEEVEKELGQCQSLFGSSFPSITQSDSLNRDHPNSFQLELCRTSVSKLRDNELIDMFNLKIGSLPAG